MDQKERKREVRNVIALILVAFEAVQDTAVAVVGKTATIRQVVG